MFSGGSRSFLVLVSTLDVLKKTVYGLAGAYPRKSVGIAELGK